MARPAPPLKPGETALRKDWVQLRYWCEGREGGHREAGGGSISTLGYIKVRGQLVPVRRVFTWNRRVAERKVHVLTTRVLGSANWTLVEGGYIRGIQIHGQYIIFIYIYISS